MWVIIFFVIFYYYYKILENWKDLWGRNTFFGVVILVRNLILSYCFKSFIPGLFI